MKTPQQDEEASFNSENERPLQVLPQIIEQEQMRVRSSVRKVADKMVMGVAVVFIGIGLTLCAINVLLMKVKEFFKKKESDTT